MLINPTRYLLQLHVQLWRLRTVDVICYGLGLLSLLAAGGWYWLADHRKMQVTQAQGEWLAQTRRIASHAPIRLTAEHDPSASLQAVLEAAKDRNSTLHSLFKLAESSSLKLDQGAYRTSLTQAAAFRVFEVALPLHGDYPAVRDFCNAVLREHENAALDELSVKKEQVAAYQAEVLLKLRFYLPADEAAMPSSSRPSKSGPATVNPGNDA